MRWMEALVERAGAGSALPTIQRLWGADRLSPSPSLPNELEGNRPAFVHRTLNFLFALAALVLLLPVMLVTALLVRLTSPGPVLYTQVRIGLDRRLPLVTNQNQR